tara:strand:- start:4314 stop:4988 length:675 start_codon:yes stop_codon:yes gene_type:complete
VILDADAKLAFIHIPNCGGTTLKKALLPLHNRFSVNVPIQVPIEYSIRHDKELLINPNEIKSSPMDHLPANYAPPGYDTITIIKNPFHREVSAYHLFLFYKTHGMFVHNINFNTFGDFIKLKYLSPPDTKIALSTTGRWRERNCAWYMKQCNEVVNNFIVPIENIALQWAELAYRYNLPEDAFGQRDNRHTPIDIDYRSLYTPELVDIVQQGTADCGAFGYTFE